MMERHLYRGALRIRPYRFLSLSICLSIAAVLLPRQTAAASTLQALPPVSIADGRLGMCNVLPGSPAPGQPTWAQMAYNAGARVNRWEFRWDRIEAKRNVWDFSKDDPAVASSITAGLAVEGILIGTPGWATPNGLTRGNSPPKGFGLPASSSRNLWADYVREVVTHYRGEVKYWEVWNEPDLSFFWSTTARDYYRML